MAKEFTEHHCSRWGGIPQGDLNDDNRLHIQVLREAFGTGVWNIPVKFDKVQWGMASTKFNVASRFASCDFDHLTRLVLAAHERCVRVEIKPCNFQYLTVTMWTRGKRSARYHDIHPTIEASIADYRKPAK